MMDSVLSLDPGSEQTAFSLIDATTRNVLVFGITPNEKLLKDLYDPVHEWGEKIAPCRHMAVEMIASYGMPVGREVFETVLWIGRYLEAWRHQWKLVYRREVKLHLCGSVTAKDGNVRQALLDKYGPGKAAAQGTKKNPGPLYGVSKDVWSAIAVGTYYLDTYEEETEALCADSITSSSRVT